MNVYAALNKIILPILHSTHTLHLVFELHVVYVEE